MPSCLDVYILQSFADGQLEEAQRATVEAHVAECPRCRRLLAQLRAVSDPLRDTAPAETPADLAQRLLAAVSDVQPLPALSCLQAQELLSASLDQVLDHVTAQRLEAHLMACPACYRAARRTDRLVAALRTVEPEPVPEGLLERVLTASERLKRERRQPVQWRRWAFSAAGLAAAAALMLVVLSQWHPATETPVARTVAVAPNVPAAVSPPTAKTPTRTAAVAPATAERGRHVQPTVARPLARLPERRLFARAPLVSQGSVATPRPGQAPLPGSPTAASPPAPVPEPSPLTVASLPRTGAVRPVAVATGEGDKPAEAVPPPAVPAPESEPASAGLAPRVLSQPAPVMVAALPVKRTTPSVEPLPPSAAETTRRSWVSRPAVEEHEVALPDSRSERVAMAEAQINDTARRIVRSQPKVWEIH